MCVPFLLPTTCKTQKPHQYFNITIAEKKKCDIETKTKNEKLKQLDEQYKQVEELKKTEMLNEMSVVLNNQLLEKQRLEEERQKYIEVEFILTFYTSLNSENGYGAVTCRGESLIDGMVASNYYSLGTIIDLGKFGEVIVADRGGSHFNTNNRLDVLITRNYGESDSHYYSRVNNMGRQVVKGKILKSSMK